jgi:hypothetical protein
LDLINLTYALHSPARLMENVLVTSRRNDSVLKC